MRAKNKKQGRGKAMLGFTLVELMITIAIIAILAALGSASLKDRRGPIEILDNMANDFTTAIYSARTMSAKDGRNYRMYINLQNVAAGLDDQWAVRASTIGIPFLAQRAGIVNSYGNEQGTVGANVASFFNVITRRGVSILKCQTCFECAAGTVPATPMGGPPAEQTGVYTIEFSPSGLFEFIDAAGVVAYEMTCYFYIGDDPREDTAGTNESYNYYAPKTEAHWMVQMRGLAGLAIPCQGWQTTCP